jgi:hypothetical protein
MNDASLVRVRQRVSHLTRITQSRVERHAAACQHRVQRLAGDVFHGDVWLAAGLADLVNGADVRVVEAGGRARFPQQPVARRLVRKPRGWQQLQGDVAVESIVMGTIDFTHSAGAEQRADLVGSDAGSAGQGHRSARAFYAIAVLSRVQSRGNNNLHVVLQRERYLADAARRSGAVGPASARGIL